MAVARIDWCSCCKSRTMHLNGDCTVCASKRDRERIIKWNTQTTARKLTDLRKRVEALERGQVRY